MTFRYFFPFAFDFCPRRALPEVEGDVEDGLGPIINSLTAEDNDVTPFAAKSKDSGEDGEMQSARLQLQSTDDLQKTMQETLKQRVSFNQIRSEIPQRVGSYDPSRAAARASRFAQEALELELFSSWNWSDLEDDTHIPSLEAILEDTDAQEFLNHATTEAAQELMKSTVSCRERLRQRSELLSCLQGPVEARKVQNQLNDVRQICATTLAFAALLGDGSIVAWGDPRFGGSTRRVQSQLQGVKQVFSNELAFAAVLESGQVVTWGNYHSCVRSPLIQNQLKDVQQISGSCGAFAALLQDRTVVTWGSASSGGDSRSVQERLKNVHEICAGRYAFAAILSDRTVVTWGLSKLGGNSKKVQDRLQNVQQICSSRCGAFAAILMDGTLVTWGDPECGGDRLHRGMFTGSCGHLRTL
eukprot:g32364.t1